MLLYLEKRHMGIIWQSKPFVIKDKNRVVIAREIMDKFKLKENDTVVYILENNNEVKLGFRYLDRETTRKLSTIRK